MVLNGDHNGLALTLRDLAILHDVESWGRHQPSSRALRWVAEGCAPGDAGAKIAFGIATQQKRRFTGQRTKEPFPLNEPPVQTGLCLRLQYSTIKMSGEWTHRNRKAFDVRVYLDNCCLNLPFDDQRQIRVRLEAEAALFILEQIRIGTLELVWSYMIDFENTANPFDEQRTTISSWRQYAASFRRPIDWRRWD